MLFENDLVRIWEMSLAPGEESPLHRLAQLRLLTSQNFLTENVVERASGYTVLFSITPEGLQAAETPLAEVELAGLAAIAFRSLARPTSGDATDGSTTRT